MEPTLRILLVSLFFAYFSENIAGQFGPDIEIDCSNDTEIFSRPFNVTLSDPFEPEITGCARADFKLQSLITYTITDQDVVRAIDSKLWSSQGFVYAMEWKIEGGRILLDNGQSASSVCIGEANQAIGPSLSICTDGLAGRGEFGPNNSFLSSSVKVQWDNKASSIKPKISVALKIQTASKFKIKIKDDFGIFKEILTSGKLSTKYELCKKEMYFGYDLFSVAFAASTTLCGNGGSKAITITPATATYDGCLYSGGVYYAYDYAYRKNGGSLSSPRRVIGNRFTIPNVGVADVIDLEITPVLGYGQRGVTYKRTLVDISKATVSNIPDVFYIDEEPEAQDFVVSGLNNLKVKFGMDVLNYSPYTYRTTGTNSVRVTWLKFPPIGTYALEVTGNDKVCGQFVRILIPFRVAKFANLVSISPMEDRTVTYRTNSEPAQSTNYVFESGSASLAREELAYKVFPSPVGRGHDMVLEKLDEDKTMDRLLHVNVYDISGRLVMHLTDRTSSSKIDVPTSALVGGVYILRVQTDDEVLLQNQRFVVN